MSRTIAALIASACVAAPAAAAAADAPTTAPVRTPQCPHAYDQPTITTIAQARSATLCLLNIQRHKAGLTTLRTQRTLSATAGHYARTLVTGKFFAHVTPGGQKLGTRLRAYEAGWSSWTIGENLAWGSGEASTPAAIVDAWMHSPGHRANILNPRFADLGIGIHLGAPTSNGTDQPAVTYVTHHGVRHGRLAR